MGWMLAVAVFLVGIIIFLWLSRLYIHCSLIYGKGKRSVIVTLRFYGIRILTKEIMIGKEKGKTANERKKQTAGKNPRDEIKQLQDGIKNFFIMIHDSELALQHLLSIISIHQFEWRTEAGTGKADTTGVAIGGIWTMKGLLNGILKEKTCFQCTPVMTVTPDFNRRCLFTKMECIVSVRTGQAIHAMMKVMQKSSIRKRETLMHEGGR